jgi:ribosomal protein L37AE/L43A
MGEDKAWTATVELCPVCRREQHRRQQVLLWAVCGSA